MYNRLWYRGYYFRNRRRILAQRKLYYRLHRDYYRGYGMCHRVLSEVMSLREFIREAIYTAKGFVFPKRREYRDNSAILRKARIYIGG
jgi:hypothetical protein